MTNDYAGNEDFYQGDLGDECLCLRCRKGLALARALSENDALCTTADVALARALSENDALCTTADVSGSGRINYADPLTLTHGPLPARGFENDSQLRKDTPIYSGLLMYFPDACAAVARLSKKANDKHNPGEPMHWAREKSNDHLDCVVRHSMTPESLDEFGEPHAVAAAWRAMAKLQLIEEKRLGDASIAAEIKRGG